MAKRIDRQLSRQEILKQERRKMGRKITLVDMRDVGDRDGGVRVVVYDCEPLEVEPGRFMQERRCAVYAGDTSQAGLILTCSFTDE